MNGSGAPPTALRPAAFLDRDGVLNVAPLRGGTPVPPASADDVVLLPGVVEACRALRDAGLVLVVVTNQPDVARGATTATEVAAINAAVVADLDVARVAMCCHDDGDGCACRKPKPGMLLDAARDLSLDLSRSTMVGDRWRDVEAGAAAEVATVFIDRGYAERKPEAPDLVVGALPDAVPFIVERSQQRESTA